LKEDALNRLAMFTEMLNLILEGHDINITHREFYVGRLAMCARLFKIIQLNQSAKELTRILKIESMSITLGMPNDDAGKSLKKCWIETSAAIQEYMEVNQQ